MLRADASGLDQILTNLFDNAIKYGEGKPVDVTLHSEGSFGVLSIRDRGIGIHPHNHERIFERFERAVSERHYGGLGLGLWICRKLVSGMDGTLEVESTPGQGATFHLNLPRVD